MSNDSVEISIPMNTWIELPLEVTLDIRAPAHRCRYFWDRVEFLLPESDLDELVKLAGLTFPEVKVAR